MNYTKVNVKRQVVKLYPLQPIPLILEKTVRVAQAAFAQGNLCNSAALRPFAKREVMPGNLQGAELERFIRDAATSFWQETRTAKMGRDTCRW